jgi:hypothetical protein
MSEGKPTTPRRARPEDAPSVRALPSKVLGLAAMIAAWSFITRQPPQVSADLLQGILILAMAVSILSMLTALIVDLRGQDDGMEMLATAGHWIATAFASVVVVLLMIGVLSVLWCFAGPAVIRLLG